MFINILSRKLSDTVLGDSENSYDFSMSFFDAFQPMTSHRIPMTTHRVVVHAVEVYGLL